MMQRVVQHWKTSIGGMLLSALLWWHTTGFKIPETKQDWAVAVGSLLITMAGLAAPDHREPPPSVPES